MSVLSTLRDLYVLAASRFRRAEAPDPAPARSGPPVPGEDYPLSVAPIQEYQVEGFAGWLMPHVQSALNGIKQGSIELAHQLLLEMTEDPMFAHGLDTRVMSLVNTPFELQRPPALPEEYFTALVSAWPDIFDENALASSAHLRIALGVAPAQVVWGLEERLGIWMPRKIAVKESGNLTWDQGLRRFRFAGEKGLFTVEDDGDPWVLFCELASAYPYLHGKLRSLAVVWWIKQASLRYLNNFARVHGSPIRKVKAPAAQRESADFKALIKQAQTLFGGGVFTAPQYDGPSFDLELVEAQSQGGSIFETAIRLADDYFTLRLLGAIDNTRGGGAGSRARAEVHERQTNKYLGSDCKVTARALTRVLRRWCTLNRWPCSWAPIPCFHAAPPADQLELADTRQKNASALGTLVQQLPTIQKQLPAPIDWRKLLEQHGVPFKDADQQVLSMADELDGVQLLLRKGTKLRKRRRIVVDSRSGGAAPSGGGGGGGAAPASSPATPRDRAQEFFGPKANISESDLTKAFDGGRHFQAELRNIYNEGDTMNAHFALVKDGRSVGRLERQFIKTAEGLKVYHAYFQLEQNAQGKGAGKEMFRNSIAFYQKLGVKEISVTAGPLSEADALFYDDEAQEERRAKRKARRAATLSESEAPASNAPASSED